jgi:hypothetical protein
MFTGRINKRFRRSGFSRDAFGMAYEKPEEHRG